MGDRRFQTSLLFSPLRKKLLFTMAMLVIVAILYILAVVNGFAHASTPGKSGRTI
jgi:hypothetical protein